jgi:hypothetical protein
VSADGCQRVFGGRVVSCVLRYCARRRRFQPHCVMRLSCVLACPFIGLFEVVETLFGGGIGVFDCVTEVLNCVSTEERYGQGAAHPVDAPDKRGGAANADDEGLV